MQEFDKYIKDNLYNHESPVPGGIWERIVSEKDKKKPSPIPIWKNGYFQSAIIAMLTVGILSSAYFYNRNNTTLVNSSLSKEAIPVVKLSNTTNSVAINSKEVNVNATNGSSTLKQESNKASLAIFASKETAGKLRDLTTNKVPVQRDLISNKTNTSFGSINNLTVTNNSNSQNIIKATITKEETFNNLTSNTKVDAPGTDNHNYEKGSIVKTSNNLLTNALISKTLSESKKTISEIHLPKKINKDWFVEVYTSPDYDIKKMNVTSTNSLYSKALDTTQKLTGGFTVGVRISKNIANHLSIKSGLQFKEVTESFRYKQFATKSSTVVTNRSYTDNNGATISTFDTSNYIQTGYKLMKTVNTYKSIEIPIIATWEVGNDKWHFAANGGIIANLATFYEGNTYDNSLNIVPLSNKQPNGVLKSNVNFCIYGSVSLLHNIGNSFDAFAEPYIRYGLSNNSFSSFGYSQRFNSFGINFGIRYKIPHSSIKN